MIGLLGTLVWAISSPVHKYFGRPVDQDQSFDLGIAVVGLTPLVGSLHCDCSGTGLLRPQIPRRATLPTGSRYPANPFRIQCPPRAVG